MHVLDMRLAPCGLVLGLSTHFVWELDAKFLEKGWGPSTSRDDELLCFECCFVSDHSNNRTRSDICHHVVVQQYTSIFLVQLL